MRVIGKGDQERLVPLPEKSGQVFGFWLKDRARGDCVFARAAGQKPVSAQAARADLPRILKKAGIDQKISPHQRRHTDAVPRLVAGAERVDLPALRGHFTISTTPMDTHMGPERMERGWRGSESSTL